MMIEQQIEEQKNDIEYFEYTSKSWMLEYLSAISHSTGFFKSPPPSWVDMPPTAYWLTLSHTMSGWHFVNEWLKMFFEAIVYNRISLIKLQ